MGRESKHFAFDLIYSSCIVHFYKIGLAECYFYMLMFNKLKGISNLLRVPYLKLLKEYLNPVERVPISNLLKGYLKPVERVSQPC